MPFGAAVRRRMRWLSAVQLSVLAWNNVDLDVSSAVEF
jgi:hypothetical protein